MGRRTSDPPPPSSLSSSSINSSSSSSNYPTSSATSSRIPIRGGAKSDQERPGTGLLHSNKSCCRRRHVLTYQDKEGDWMLVGDVPWE
ncbi:hypothetical protein RJ640_021643 [Escallonia rubra]|uniref:Auxin-responsive protein n=1 Tax=Escallonia rubra TaxID=112253 RepID=A0AA88QIQ6_9ASTE|nr:hypothetical protein RJ640_021643 [Escallonia rubra]